MAYITVPDDAPEQPARPYTAVPDDEHHQAAPEGTIEPGVMAAASRFGRGVAGGLIGGAGELEQGAADVYNRVAGGKPEENPVHQQGTRVKEYGESFLNPAERETFTGKAGNVVGGVAPYLGATAAAAAAAPLVGASAAVGSAVGLSAAAMIGAFQSYEGGRSRALEEGATEDQADSAAWKEAAVGAGAAALPVGAVLRPIVRAGPGVREAVKAVLKKGAQDGVVFTSVADAQQFINNAVDRAYAPERPLTEGIYDPSKSVGENVAQQAPTAAAGFLLGGGHGALEAVRHRAVPAPAPGEPPPPVATTPTPEQQAAAPPGFTPVIEDGAVQGYRDAKGGYHDADEVHAAQAAAQQPGPPDAHGVLANIAEGKPAQTPRPPTPEPPTTPLPPDNPGSITEAKGEPAPVTSMPVVDRGKVQLAGEQQQLQQSDRQLVEFLGNLDISKDAPAAADKLARVQAVDQQLQNPDLTSQDRNTLVRRRDELLADTNPETLQETAAPLEMQRQALQQRQRIADRLRDINAQLGDTEQATALSPLPKPEPVSQTPEPPIAPSEPITNGLQQAPVTRDAVAAAIADPTTRVSQLYTQLRDALNKLGLDQVGLRLEGKIAAVAEGKASAADGQYLDRLIQVALDNKLGEPGMQLTLHHEAVHAMRDLGLFTDAEWRVLSKSPEVRARIAEIEDRYKKQEVAISPETLIEEAIADQMAAWSMKPPPSLLGRIYNKIVNLLHSIGNALRGNGFNSVGDIAEHFRSGEIGRRPEMQSTAAEPKLALRRPEEDEMPKIPGRDGLTNPLKIPNDASDRLARKLKRGDQKRGGVGAPTQTRAVKLPDGVHIGPVNVHQWIARVEKILTPEEIDRARTWYEDALPAYEKYFGKDKAPAMLGAWLMANQNATPGFAQLSAVRALEQYTNATSGKPGSLKAGLPHDKLMQYWGAIQGGDLSKLGDITTGQKIYDFIDSALQKNTRTFYGDDARAGAPAVADIHSFRDTGTIDDPMLAWVRNKFGDKVANKLTSDGPTAGRKEAPYEWAADRMRAWTDELNAQKYLGHDDWSPHQVQAVGWMTMSKMLGRPGMTAERAITANIRNLSYELDPGAGAPFNKTFPEWAGLSDDAKARISDAVLPRIVDIAKEIAGATEFARVKGLGGWHEFTNPAFKSRLIASPEVAGDVADIVGYLAEQTKVFGYRWIATGRKVGVSIYGDTLHDSAVVGKLWDRIVEKHPDLAAGFSPSIDANGTHGIEILLDRGGDAVLKRVAREMVPTIDAFAEESALGDVHIRTFKAAEESRANDWTRDPEGEGYLSRLDSRYGPEIRQRLELHKREEIEPAIRAGIDAERNPVEPAGKLSLRRDEFPEEADRPLAAPIPLDRLHAGPDSQREILGRFGTFSPGDDTTERLKIYNLQHLVDDPTRVDQVLDRYGFRAKYFAYAPDEKAGVAVKLPRIAKDGYANGTVWIYDPRSADGSFKDATYTNAWRLTHEIGHALTEPLLADKYGASHREGQLGQEREVYRGKYPNGKMVKVRGLTLDEAQRAIEWEDLAFRAQRRVLEQAGEKISDADFAHEYNINLSDAIYRTLTGEFGNPGEYGFLPADKPNTLRDALALLERSEAELAQSQGREPTKGVDLSTWQPASDADVARAIEHGAANPRAGNSSESERPLGPKLSLRRDDEKRDPFFAMLTRSVEDIRQEKAPATQWANMIRNLTQKGVKQDEIDWSGVHDWLKDQKGVVTKDQVLDHLRSNEVEVHEVEKSGPVALTKKQALNALSDFILRGREFQADDNGALSGFGNAVADGAGQAQREIKRDGFMDPSTVYVSFADELGRAQRRLGLDDNDDVTELVRDVANTTGSNPTKFGQYVMSGGENYRELLLTLPERNAILNPPDKSTWRTEVVREIPGGQREVRVVDGDGEMMALLSATRKSDREAIDFAYNEHMRNIGNEANARVNYKSSHWDEPNVLAHIRMNDRTDAEGKRVLFVEEMQSDWHQQGRRKGYKTAEWEKASDEIRKEMVDISQQQMEVPPGPEQKHRREVLEERRLALQRERQRLRQANEVGVPDAPFKTQWPEMAMKRVMRYAAENGYDRIAWTPGDVQNERYNLADHIGEIRANKNAQGYWLEADRKGYPRADNAVIKREMTEGELENTVGKDVAKRIVDAVEANENVGHDRVKKAYVTLSGLDLQVGGEGMKGFYDKMLPSIASKLGKKWGAKAGTSEIAVREAAKLDEKTVRLALQDALHAADQDAADQLDPLLDALEHGANTDRAMADLGHEGRAYLDAVVAPESKSVHALDVTPEMREGVMQGQPMWSLRRDRAEDISALDHIERETGDRISVRALDEARGPLWSLRSASKTGTTEQEDVMKRVLQFHADVPFGQKIREAWNELRKDGIAKFRYGMLDRLDAVAQMEKGQNAGKLLDAQVGAYKAMRMTTNLSSVMHVLLKKGMISYDKGEFKPAAGFEGGFEAIFKPLAESGKVRLWQAWAVANRANRLLREGREKLMEQSDIDALLPLGNQYPEFAQVLAKYQAFNQKILDMAQQTGLIDADLRAKLRSNDYVPFYRILDQDGKVGGPGVKGGVGGQSAGVMRLKGGEAMVNDLFNNMTRNMSRMVDASFKNLAAVRTIDMAVKAGAAVRRPPDFKPVHHSATELQDALDNMGIGSDVIPASMKDFAVKMFTMVQPKDGDVVSIKREGKTEYYTISDPMMLAAFGPAHVKQNGLVMFGGKFSNLLRRGVTVMPDFMTANFIRDTMSAWVVSGGKTNPLKAVSGFISALRNSPEAQEIAAAGGGGKGYYNVLPHDVAHQLSDDMAHSTKSVLHKAFEIWEKVGQASEQANRIAVYKTLKKQGATNAEAAYQAVDLLDFSMRGDFAAMRSITTLVPFLNARAQGIYKLWRAAKENPAGFWMRGTAIMLPALALTLNNIGQPWYDELSPNDKELYTHFMIGGQHFRLPKPFEIGALFMTAPEILANAWYGTEYGQHTTQRAAAVLMDQFNFNPTPQAIKPAMDQLMNQQGIGGNPIESHHWQDLPPAQRFTPRTSTLAKMLGQATDMSPLRIDAAISGYFGSFGSMVGAITTGVDHAFSNTPVPTKRVEELPLIGRYVRNEPALSTQWSQSWYAIAADAQQVVKGVKQYQESGEPKAATKLLQDNPGAKWIATHAQQVNKQLSTIAKMEQRIQNAPDPSKPGGMSSDEKRTKIDELIARRNQIQRNAVESARKVMGRKEGPPA